MFEAIAIYKRVKHNFVYLLGSSSACVAMVKAHHCPFSLPTFISMLFPHAN